MNRKPGSIALVFALLALVASTKAETVQAALSLSPANEIPPNNGIVASGVSQFTLTVSRDSTGAITGGSVRFHVAVSFPGSVTVTGLHIHEASATANGPIVIDTGISDSSPIRFATGAGSIDLTVDNIHPAVLARLLKKPSGFYVNLHTSANPGGAIRGQFIWFEERLSQTISLATAAEIPPVTNGLSGNGVATITAIPTRDDKGAVTGGAVTFSMQYDLPADSTLTGLHIHEGAPDVAGPVVINTGLSVSNTVMLPTGKDSANYVIPISLLNLAAFRRMLANPAGFYVNVTTNANPSGIIRGQLSSQMTAPPIIQQADTYFLETGNTDAAVRLLVAGVGMATTTVINGHPVSLLPDLSTGLLTLNIPAALRANAGVLFVQLRNASGVMSTPIHIVVAPAASISPTAATVVDAARFSVTVAPESIASVFGTRLASSTLSANTPLLPTLLDGTSVFVNGIKAPLFFVSPSQVNFIIPRCPIPPPPCPCPPPPCLTCPPVPWKIVILDQKNGLVSLGSMNVTPSSPGIFTRLGNGQGAPAAVASVDGQSFNIPLSNADGTPAAIDAGNFVSLFGTGLRWGTSDPMPPLMIGMTPVTLLYAGAQGQFNGLDQVNFQVPANLAGRGELDLTIQMPDGKISNTVRLKIR